jgi:hypothetical protein
LPSHNVRKPEHRYGSRTGSLDNDPRFIQVARGQSTSGNFPIPEPDPKWKPTARSWFNSLKLSGQSEFYEPSDWATAVAAAQAYDVFLRTYNASIFAQFVRLSERLGCTVLDRKRGRVELSEPDPTDEDEDEADDAVEGWHDRLRVVD